MIALVGQIIVGWLLADLVSGMLHWVEDRILPDGLPLIDRAIVQPNRLHHADPMAFVSGSLLDRNGTTWAATLVILLPALFAFGPAPWLIAAGIGGAMASQVHYWAHRPPPSKSWLAALQLTGVIQSPMAHARHHRAETSHFCILTGLLNPLLDRSNVWTGLERLMRVRVA